MKNLKHLITNKINEINNDFFRRTVNNQTSCDVSLNTLSIDLVVSVLLYTRDISIKN